MIRLNAPSAARRAEHLTQRNYRGQYRQQPKWDDCDGAVCGVEVKAEAVDVAKGPVQIEREWQIIARQVTPRRRLKGETFEKQTMDVPYGPAICVIPVRHTKYIVVGNGGWRRGTQGSIELPR